jgi:hypothetical protein
MAKDVNGTTVAVKQLDGRALVHRKLDARQRACIAVALINGELALRPSARQAAQVTGASLAYLGAARKLSESKRHAIIEGKDSTSIAALLAAPEPVLALSAPVDDRTLMQVIRSAGIERTLDAAISIESRA